MTGQVATPSGVDDPLAAWALLAETYQGLSAVLAPQLNEHGLSETEFDAMLRLLRADGQRLRMSDLAAQSSLTTSGISRVIDRLERDGLVCRETCDSDRRGYWAALTADGDQRVSSALEGHVALIDEHFTALLAPDELDALTHALRVVRDTVRSAARPGP